MYEKKVDEHQKVVDNVKEQDKINFFNKKGLLVGFFPIQRQNDVGVLQGCRKSLLFDGTRHTSKTTKLPSLVWELGKPRGFHAKPNIPARES